MRQEEKQAAGAARELLDAAAARERKATAATQARKTGVTRSSASAVRSASTGTPKGMGRTAPTLEEKGAAAVSGAGFGAAASPASFTGGRSFFTGAGPFFTNTGHIPMSQPWMAPQSSDPATW